MSAKTELKAARAAAVELNEALAEVAGNAFLMWQAMAESKHWPMATAVAIACTDDELFCLPSAEDGQCFCAFTFPDGVLVPPETLETAAFKALEWEQFGIRIAEPVRH